MSSDIGEPLVKAIVAFIAVNVDEFIVLVLFFPRVDGKEMKINHVITGQLVGFTIIFLISAIGFLLVSFIKLKYVALIGLLPLGIGLYQFYKVLKYWSKQLKLCESKQDTSIVELNSEGMQSAGNPLQQPQESTSHRHQDGVNETKINGKESDSNVHNDSVTIESGMKPDSATTITNKANDSDSDSSSDSDDEKGPIMDCFRHYAGNCLHPSTLTVTVTIIADGAEEIGVFIPLFATTTPAGVVVTIITFYILVLVNCLLAYQVVRCKKIVQFFSRYSKNIMPLVLIGLGLHVLRDSILADEITGN
jgi:cadmium resistance protein CadD (predicted permease)